MHTPIESPTALIRQLGLNLDFLKTLDPYQKNRDETKKFRSRLLSEYGTSCGYCYRSFGKDEVETAHIIPLEIGGRTECENLILLCMNCHQKYDSGYCSISHMKDVAKNWRARISANQPPFCEEINVIAPMRFIPPLEIAGVLGKVSLLQERRAYCKAIGLIQKHLANCTTSAAARSYLMVKKAEMNRRRSAQRTTDVALNILNKITPDDVPPDARSYYYYELGYLNRLIGRHKFAANHFHLSAEVARPRKKDQPSVDYIAASGNELLCRMAMEIELSSESADSFKAGFDRLKKIALRNCNYWGWRWALNCSVHALQACIRTGDSDRSWKRLEQTRHEYFKSDRTKGWHIEARQTMTLLEGLVRVLFPRNQDDLESGIGLLARAFVTRLGRRQRPEGIRDVGFGLAIGLKKQDERGKRKIVQLLDELMCATVDGTSVIYPSRAS